MSVKCQCCVCCNAGLVRLSYNLYFSTYFFSWNSFFFRNKSVNSTFSHGFSAKRTGLQSESNKCVVSCLNKLTKAFRVIYCFARTWTSFYFPERPSVRKCNGQSVSQLTSVYIVVLLYIKVKFTSVKKNIYIIYEVIFLSTCNTSN
jgi:hypothetical protein